MYASDITSFLGQQHLLCTESRPPSAMTHFFSLQDFQSELTHLEKLVTMLPDSPVVASMITTFSHKLQGVKTWSSESIVTLPSTQHPRGAQEDLAYHPESASRCQQSHEVVQLRPDGGPSSILFHPIRMGKAGQPCQHR